MRPSSSASSSDRGRPKPPFDALIASGIAERRQDYEGLLAAAYDQIEGRRDDDIGLYLSLLEDHGTCEILDLGAGSGRLSIPLAKAGHHVKAVDNAPAMLSQLKAKTSNDNLRIDLHQGSMTRLDLPHASFDVCLIGYNNLHHLTTVSERMDCLQTASRLLRPGGRLLIDVELSAVTGGPNGGGGGFWAIVVPGPNGSQRLFVDFSFYQEESQTRVTQFLCLELAPDKTYHAEIVDSVDHIPTAAEMKSSILDLGFSIEGFWGDCQKTPFRDHPKKNRLIINAVKPT